MVRERRFVVQILGAGSTNLTAAAVRETSKLPLKRYHQKYLNNVQPQPEASARAHFLITDSLFAHTRLKPS
jgi:hypothetical protein